jgi:hypothetical protein
MSRETLFLVQAWAAGKGRGMKADQPLQFKNAEAAVRSAQRLEPIRLGVVAYKTEVDEEVGHYGDPEILFSAGRLPPPFGDG